LGSLKIQFNKIRDGIVPGLAVLFLAFFAWKHIRYAITATVQFDDAFIANVAKNLAEGHGYSASYYGLHPFHLEITTGPTVVLPAAALIRLLGNRYWVPTLAYTLIVAVALIELLAMLSRRFGRREFGTAAFLIAYGLFAFGAQEIGLLGELPAALLTAIAALLLTRGDEWREAAAGLLLGLAILAKTVAALALPTFVLAILTLPIFHARRRRATAIFLACMAAPIVMFELWKFAVVGSLSDWMTLMTAEVLDVVGPNAPLSGSATVVAALSSPRVLVDNSLRNLTPLLAWWGGTRNPLIAPIWFSGRLPALLAAAAIVLAFVVGLRSRRDDVDATASTAGLLLIGAGVTSFFWWLTLAPMGWPRHAMPGLIRALIGTAIVVAAAGPRNRRAAAVSAFLLVIALAPNAFELRDPANPISDLVDDIRGGPERTPRLRALLQAAEYLHNTVVADPSVQLVGCGWSHNPALEFLMPGSDHFRDCIRVRRHAFRNHRLILVRGEYFNQLKLPDIQRFQQWCEQKVLFRALSWVVSECPGPPPEPPWTVE
jgi:hypothetical protein